MHNRFTVRTAILGFSTLLGDGPARALDPMDAFPPTDFSVSLLAGPPPGFAFTSTVNFPRCFGSTTTGPLTISYNFTPYLNDDCERNVVWDVAAAMGAKVRGGKWGSSACMLGDISRLRPGAANLICSSAFQGSAGPGLLFGVAGAPLSTAFNIEKGSDTVQLGASLDNVGPKSTADASGALDAALGDGLQGFGSLTQGAGTVAANASFGTPLTLFGGLVAVLGSLVAVDADLNQATSEEAQWRCLGDFLGNPPSGSMIPQDAAGTTISAKQLYEGTRNGPLYLTNSTTMDYAPPIPPQGFQSCRAATSITFVIDRPKDPGTNAWTNGLAFQPRSPDSAVVRRPNAIESFQVDPVTHRLRHDSWRYTPYEATLDPTDGLALCNGPQSCSPSHWSEPVEHYIASAADPSMQHPPTLTSVATRVTALSPDPSRLTLFFC
ncbi:MAG: hypothetical protein JO122_15560 [Acetobacteraceae bacterium]|nr:hypothetical protein [Acetobacteraceae bacterium]